MTPPAQTLIEMGAVGGEDVFPAAQATEQGKGGVEDKGPDEQHAGQGTGTVLRRDDGQDRTRDTQQGQPTAKANAQESVSIRPIRRIRVLCLAHPRQPRATSTTLDKSPSVRLEPEGRHSPSRNSSSATPVPTYSQPAKTGCKVYGFPDGTLLAMILASRARRMVSRSTPKAAGATVITVSQRVWRPQGAQHLQLSAIVPA